MAGWRTMIPSPRRQEGLGHVLAATAIGGGAAYLLTVWAGVRLGEAYTPFAVFWSALYLVIGALSGVQQEVTRATRLVDSPALRRPVARNFAASAALIVAVVALATSPAWVGPVFDDHGLLLAVPLAIGAAAYAVVAVLSGVFYGLALWTAVGGMIALDGVLRLVLTGALLAFTDDTRVLVWAVVAPFVIVPAVFWLRFRGRVVGRFELDVGYGRLTANVARTVVGALATGVLVSGFPLFVGASSADVRAGMLAGTLFVITVARAPLVIALLSLQSYLVLRFRTSGDRLLPAVAGVLALVAVAAALLAVIAGLVGPWLIATVVGDGLVVDAGLTAAIVGSGGLVAALCVTGPATLSRSQHTANAVGWIVAAAVTIGALALPLEFEVRVVAALFVGPAAGLLVHAAALLGGRAQTEAA